MLHIGNIGVHQDVLGVGIDFWRIGRPLLLKVWLWGDPPIQQQFSFSRRFRVRWALTEKVDLIGYYSLAISLRDFDSSIFLSTPTLHLTKAGSMRLIWCGCLSTIILLLNLCTSTFLAVSRGWGNFVLCPQSTPSFLSSQYSLASLLSWSCLQNRKAACPTPPHDSTTNGKKS